MPASKITKCQICNEECGTVYNLQKHKKQTGHWKFKYPRHEESQSLNVQDKIAQGEKLIQDAPRDIDIEQHKLQERILELDNFRAKYKKV